MPDISIPSTQSGGTHESNCLSGNWCNLSLLTARRVADAWGRSAAGAWYVHPELYRGSEVKLANAFAGILGEWAVPQRDRPYVTYKQHYANVSIVPWKPGNSAPVRLNFFLAERASRPLVVAVGGGLQQTLECEPTFDKPSILTSLLHIYMHMVQTDFECVHPFYMSFLRTGRCVPTPDELIWRYTTFKTPKG